MSGMLLGPGLGRQAHAPVRYDQHGAVLHRAIQRLLWCRGRARPCLSGGTCSGLALAKAKRCRIQSTCSCSGAIRTCWRSQQRRARPHPTCTTASLSASSADVASSSSSTEGRRTRARAMAIRCFWPPLRTSGWKAGAVRFKEFLPLLQQACGGSGRQPAAAGSQQ